jgi:antitoxin VapB
MALSNKDDSSNAARRAELRKFLESEIWPQIPAEALGQSISRAEREAILGYGKEGV